MRHKGNNFLRFWHKLLILAEARMLPVISAGDLTRFCRRWSVPIRIIRLVTWIPLEFSNPQGGITLQRLFNDFACQNFVKSGGCLEFPHPLEPTIVSQ